LVVVVSVDPEMVGSTSKQTHGAPLGENSKAQQDTNLMKEATEASSLDSDHRKLKEDLQNKADRAIHEVLGGDVALDDKAGMSAILGEQDLGSRADELARFSDAVEAINRQNTGSAKTKVLEKLFAGLLKILKGNMERTTTSELKVANAEIARLKEKLNTNKSSGKSNAVRRSTTKTSSKAAVAAPVGNPKTPRGGTEMWRSRDSVGKPNSDRYHFNSCGLSTKQKHQLEASMGCPYKDGHYIERVLSGPAARQGMYNSLTTVLNLVQGMAFIMGVGTKTLPSDLCCQALPANAQRDTRWTPKLASLCCGKTPEMKCDLKNKRDTCLKLIKPKKFEDPGRNPRRESDKKLWGKEQPLKCNPRELANVNDLPGTQGVPYKEVGEDNGAKWGWAKKKLKKAKKYAKKKWKKAKKHAKKKWKKVKKHAKKKWKKAKNSLKQFGMKKIMPWVIRKLVKLVPKKYRGIVKVMIPPLMKGHIKAALKKGLESKAALQLIPKRYHGFVKMIVPDIIDGKTKDLKTKLVMQARTLFIGPYMEKKKLVTHPRTLLS